MCREPLASGVDAGVQFLDPGADALINTGIDALGIGTLFQTRRRDSRSDAHVVDPQHPAARSLARH